MTATVTVLGSIEASKILGIDRATLTRWVASERIKPIGRIGGNDKNAAFVFDEADVKALAAKIAERKAEAPQREALAERARAAYLRAVDAINAGEIDPTSVIDFEFAPVHARRAKSA